VSKNTVAEKSSGAHSLNKGHEKPSKGSGAHHNTAKGHEVPSNDQGAHAAKAKPLVHAESDTQHNGRQHPPATKLADNKILGGKLRKAE
jgi:hypothetical protein